MAHITAHITIGNWDKQKNDARAIRYDVFVIEQNIPANLEWDELDPLCIHAIAYDEENRATGTGRLLPDGHIGRMAVRPTARHTGIGSMILQALMQEAQKRGDRAVMLHAQTHAEPFYARHGFVREGEVFMEADKPHISMRYSFA